MNSLPQAALITGGAKRIGKAMVEALAAQGTAVAIHYRSSGDEAEALAQDMRAKGGQAVTVQADLQSRDDVKALIPKAQDVLGQPLDLLVHNASLFEDDRADSLQDDLFQAHFDIHVKAVAFLSEAFAKALPKGREGLIVMMIDQRVWALKPDFFSYTLSKSALWTMTQTMAQSFAPYIRVNAIAPGPTLQNIHQSRDEFDAQMRSVLLQKGPALQEFGLTLRYLWEAKSVTGQMIALDGGQHLS